MESVDLNLDNYSLDDLLSLFSLRVDFSGHDLRQARRIVVRSHPDKSGLSPDYFRFFNNAYHLLEEVYRAQASREHAAERERAGPRPEEIEYGFDRDEGVAKTLSKYTETPGFNKTFNELFEKHAGFAHDRGDGHGEWFKSSKAPAHAGSREEVFAASKREARALACRNDIVAAGIGGGLAHSELVQGADDSFGCSTSSSLPYQDLRQAHEQSVIPVTEEDDFHSRQKYAGVGQLKAEREHMDRSVVIPSQADARRMLDEEESQERCAGAHRAFALAKQHDQARTASQDMLAGMLRLTGSPQ
tara:strand:- start:10320 stop:11225 length:906 start_codon:yes stop_codon:yes gene_type:complete